MRGKTWRSVIGVVAAAAMLAAGCGDDDDGGGGGGAAGGAEVKSSISIGVQTPLTELPVLMAEQKGYFEEHGISDVELVNFSQPPAMMAAVAKGQVDLGNQTVPVVAGYNAGSSGDKLRFLAPSSGVSLTWIGSNDAGVPPATETDYKQSVSAWRGKTIGAPALGGQLDVLTRYVATQAGLEEGTDYEMRATGAGAQAIAALKAGVVDMLAAEPFSAAAIETANLGQRVLDVEAGQGPPELQDTVGSAYFAPDGAIAENDATYAAFTAALEQGRKAMFDPANEEAAVSLITDTLKVDDAVAQAYYDNGLQIFDTELSAEMVDATVEAFAKAGLIEAPSPSSEELLATVEPAP
jgi:ABC-type nitrate/sulfonate/bicarbonate transport system substrate-binding protein